jgi:D-alanyl-D-alanine carboxypeptidase (penicillin-binding protein 5/6)
MRRLRAFAVFSLSLFAAVLASQAPASAFIDTSAEHALLMDGDTGQILWQKAGMVAMPPASMSKLMTIELVFQRLKDGRIKLTDTLPVSETAWRTGGSKGFVRVGDRLTVEDLIRRILIVSGNDACVVVAEGLGGTLDGFVGLMNKRARELGLTQSHFVNPDGLPDPPGQLMSAYDLAKLSRHLIKDYPQYYHYFSERSYTTTDQGKQITQPNRNQVLDRFPGADGLKTGHTDVSGYGVTASAVRDGQRMILVLNGLRYPDLDKDAPQKQDWFAEMRRGEEAARVLGVAFREFRKYKLLDANAVAGNAKVFGGAEATVPLTAGKPVAITLQVDSRPTMRVAVKYSGPVQAPIAKGQQIGVLEVTAQDFPKMTVPLYAANDVPRAGIFSRIGLAISHLLGRDK